MQRRRSAIEADIAGNRRRTRQRVERLRLGDLMDESSRGEHVEEIGLVGVHRATFRDHAPCYADGGAGGVTGPALYAKALDAKVFDAKVLGHAQAPRPLTGGALAKP